MVKEIVERIYLKMPGNLAYYDSLTGLHNRLYYDRVVKKHFCDKECYIYYIDINGLKKVNDEEGHTAGDELIKSVAEDIKQIDCLASCRIGGDEFVVITDKKTEVYIIEASVGTYHLGLYEDVSSGVKKADESMYINKTVKGARR